MPYPVNLGWIIPVEVESNENSYVLMVLVIIFYKLFLQANW